MRNLLKLQGRSFSSYGVKTFDKVLVANRGEITRRIFKSCKKMGIKTVAVYSDADRHSMFVKEADEAFRIGPPPTNQSYLLMDTIVEVAKKTKANAVHPGYGFLSERAVFQKALSDNGIVFIGPNSKAIEAMGDKIESKKVAHAAKVNTIPGYMGIIENAEEAKKIAKDIGYPVMIKASAGGGGKGMRIAWNDKETEIGFRLSAEEALSSFGDGRLFIEKYIEEPRHIEYQILGDMHGNYVYLPERECSVQRRNQKVIEEAPCAIMDPKTRHAMGTQACSLARECGYYTTGTCEFLMDKHKQFYFLEMNTRLQVEHPITEEITGIDLVEEMIKISAGHKLPYKQEDVKINGHSIEYRLYAEDPARKFLPSIGFLKKYNEPITKEHMRIDTGVEEGSEISMYYDPMISKLVVWGKDRTEAIDRLNLGIDEYVINGVNHNSGFCKAIINNESFRKGQYTTAFIPTFYPDGYKGEVMTTQDNKLLAVMAHRLRHIMNNRFHLKGVEYPENNDHLNPLYMEIGEKKYKVMEDFEKEEYVVEEVGVEKQETTPYDRIKFNKFDLIKNALIKAETLDLNQNKAISQTLQFTGLENFHIYNFFYRGSKVKVEVLDSAQETLKQFMAPPVKVDYSKAVISPMPGNVVSVSVEPGQTVVDGQELLIIEAMKMQNIIRSEVEAKIKKINCKLNSPVAVDELLIEFE